MVSSRGIGILCALILGIAPSASCSPSHDDLVGEIKRYEVPDISNFAYLAVALDGNGWLAGGNLTDSAYRLDRTGQFARFRLPHIDGTQNVACDSVGNTWYNVVIATAIPAEYDSAIIELSADGKIITTIRPHRDVSELALGQSRDHKEHVFGPFARVNPADLTVDRDGNVWFTAEAAGKVGEITAAGRSRVFSLPDRLAYPRSPIQGPDSGIWFVEPGTNHIGRISATGKVKEFSLPLADSGPSSITNGPDGNLWFVETNADRIGRITTQGNIVDFASPASPGEPVAIIGDNEGGLWLLSDAKSSELLPIWSTSQLVHIRIK